MNFTEALAAKERGEKVCRSCWVKGTYIFVAPNNDSIFDDSGRIFQLKRCDYKATDWEIYKPELVLNPCGCGEIPRLKTGTTLSRVECKCGMMTDSFEKDKAITVWNTAHPVAEKPNKEIKVGDWVFFNDYMKSNTKCAKVLCIRDDFFETSYGDVLKSDLIGKAIVATATEPKKRTNFEALFVPWMEKNPDLGICNYICKFILPVDSCVNVRCFECHKRFVAHLQQEYKEVKE